MIFSPRLQRYSTPSVWRGQLSSQPVTLSTIERRYVDWSRRWSLLSFVGVPSCMRKCSTDWDLCNCPCHEWGRSCWTALAPARLCPRYLTRWPSSLWGDNADNILVSAPRLCCSVMMGTTSTPLSTITLPTVALLSTPCLGLSTQVGYCQIYPRDSSS